jgi:hypothetical protein
VEKLRRRVADLFNATRDRLSVEDICAHGFDLRGQPNWMQRFAAIRTALRMIRRAAAARERLESHLRRSIAEAEEILGRPSRRRDVYFGLGDSLVGVDREFAKAMQTTPNWSAWDEEWAELKEATEFGWDILRWRMTKTDDRRVWFHRADYPMRIWAVSVQGRRGDLGRGRDH